MAALSKLRQRQDLATADRHIAEAGRRSPQQLVRELGADGHDTAMRRDLLRIMQRNLDVMNAHRQQIGRALSRGPGKRS